MSIDLKNPVHKQLVESGLAASNRGQEGVKRIDGKKTTLGKDDFMKILMAEVKNQDPFNPMDSKEYGAHLAQFAQLEQMVNMNTNLGQINSTQSVGNKNELVNYIGKEIFAENDTFDFVPGKEASLPYNLEKDAEFVEISIHDLTTGELVTTLNPGKNSAGTYSVKWDGKDSEGIIRSDGKFNYKVAAKNLFNIEVPADTYMKGTVTGVSFEGNKPVLMIGENQVGLENIKKVFVKK